MSRWIYGIDFGTSNSALSIYDKESDQLVSLPKERKPIESSLIYFPKGTMRTPYIGNEAREQYIQSGMKGRFMQSIKSFLSDTTFTKTDVFGDEYSLEQLVALMMRHFKKKADDYLGEDVEAVVIGRPAVFSDDKEKEQRAQERLYLGARLAGFKQIKFQLEPIAAAFSYEQRLEKSETVLVVDLGGGTSDFTIMKLDPKKIHQHDRQSDIIASSGVYIGGNNYDSEIMYNKITPYLGKNAKYRDYNKWLDIPTHVHRTICEWHQVHFVKQDRQLMSELKRMSQFSDQPEEIARLLYFVEENLGYSIFQAIEKSKIDLTHQMDAFLKYNHEQLTLTEIVTQREFKRFTEKQTQGIADCLDELLKKTGYSVDQIDSVFMTGGTSLIPHVREVFESRFGADKLRGGNTFTSVVDGLALSAPVLF
jgi:hypothetical chaperone protein